MLQGSSYRGVNAIFTLSEEVEYFSDLPDWQNLCLQIYQGLEKIGTGGLGFRKLHHNFLIQVNSLLDNELRKVLPIMNELEKLYKVMSKYFFLASRRQDITYLKKLKKIIFSIAMTEEELWKMIFQITTDRKKEILIN